MKKCVVILARGGSKEIPSKNIIDVNGKPLLYYTISASQQSDVDATWVSTDCPKIKKIAENFNANVIDRPTNISGDYSQSEEALLHFAKNINFDILVFIQPTSPLLKAADINKGIKLLEDENCAYMVCVLPKDAEDDDFVGVHVTSERQALKMLNGIQDFLNQGDGGYLH